MPLSQPALFHLATVAPAFVLGAIVLAMPKGTPTHKLLGRIWASLMVITCIISFWVRHNGFSWIHGLSVLALFCVTMAVISIRRGNVRSHRGFMLGAYLGSVGALMGALAPGRFLHGVFFG